MTNERESMRELMGEMEQLRRRIAELERSIAMNALAQEAVRESEIRLRTAVESLPFDFFLIGPDGRYVMQNSACKRTWGDVIGKRPEDVCPDSRTCALWQANNARAFAGEVVEDEVVFESPSGMRYYRNIISPIRDGDEIRGILGVNIDITARRQAEHALQKLNEELEKRVHDRTADLEVSNRRLEAEMESRRQVEVKLRQSEIQYRTLVESAGESIIQVDGDGRFLFMNRVAARYLGGKPEDYIGGTVRDIFPPEAAQRQLRNVLAVIQTGRGIAAEVPVSFQEKIIWFNATFEPLVDSTGTVGSVLIIARDIQELRQVRKELRAYEEHMARTERLASLGTLSAMVAHEMNQPLTVIRLTVQNCLAQLRAEGVTAEVIEDLESCVEEISAAGAIVDRFKSFAKESARGRTVRVNLREVAVKVLHMWEESAREARVAFSLDGLDRVPDVYIDEGDIEQIFFSLVANAVEAADGRRDHVLSIRGMVEEGGIELAFADDCGGIASKDMGKIFRPFFTTKDTEHATGLGLCIVERILGKIGGKVRVDNRPGAGVTFIIRLPMGDDSERG